MFNSFLIVGTQVLILFILIATGFICGKIKLLNDSGVNNINDIMLYIVTPCVIVNALQRPFEPNLLKGLILSIGSAILAHIISFIMGLIFIHNKDEARKRLMRFDIVFSNCGFMALPLLEAVLGKEGMFYGAGYLAVFNIIVWSFGQYAMAKSGDGEFDKKKIILNPGVLASLLGLILFFTSVTLPEIIISPVSSLASLNTPVAMLIIGYSMSKIEMKSIRNLGDGYLAIAIRLVISPLVLLGVLYILGYRGNLLSSCIISACTPVAAISTMFSIKYHLDEGLASRIVAASTLFSILSMTIIVGIAQTIG